MSQPCTLYLITLSTSQSSFISLLQKAKPKPLVVSKVLGWVSTPEKLSVASLGADTKKWDLVVILPNTDPQPSAWTAMIKESWRIPFSPSADEVSSFPARNRALLHPAPGSVPAVTESAPVTASTMRHEHLEFALSPSLDAFLRATIHGPDGGRAVTMLNLIATVPGSTGYQTYIAEFEPAFGARYGPTAKLKGEAKGDEEDARRWEMVALVHYPSVLHFREMVLSETYVEMDGRCKVGSKLDNPILACVDLDLDLEGEVEVEVEGE